MYVRQLLSPEEVIIIEKQLQGVHWTHGRHTAGYEGQKSKDNYQASYTPDNVEELVKIALLRDKKYQELVQPVKETRVRVSKTPLGGRYGLHHDMPGLGDYSTTVFLNNDFEGGELVLSDGLDLKQVKLQPGWAITYESGTPHQVNEVLDGERRVCVFWSKSKFTDPAIRKVYADISAAIERFPLFNDDIVYGTEDIRFRLRDSLYTLERRFSNP